MMKVNKELENNLICIASIGKPRGLKGEFFLNSFCNPKENILNYSEFFIQDNKISNFKIEYIRKINSKFYSKIAGIDDIDSIKIYTNLKILVSKDDLPLLKDDEAYWYELEGMIVIDQESGDILGSVDSLSNFGAQDCIQVKPSEKSVDNTPRLIPYVKDEYIKLVDRDNKIIFVNWDKDYLI